MNGNEVSDNQVEHVSEGVHTGGFEVLNRFQKPKLIMFFIFSIFSENKLTYPFRDSLLAARLFLSRN